MNMSNRGHSSTTARIRAYATRRRRRAIFPVKRWLVRSKPVSNFSNRWSTIQTTLPQLPLPSNSERETTTTRRLTLRPMNDDSHDLEALHALCTDEKVMRWSPQGKVDADLDETHAEDLHCLVPPFKSENLVYAICLKSTEEFIGYGGLSCLPGRLGWPEVSFGIKSDHWGQGYATEFLEGFLGIWRRLPRTMVVTKVHVSTVYGDFEIKDECLTGIPTYDNVACHRVLEKSGLEKRVDWEEYNFKSRKGERLYGWVMAKRNEYLLEEQLSALRIT